MAPPVTPRDAASLLIVRERKSGPQVLMGRRPTKDRFMPDVFVFPGGRVDPGDARLDVRADLPALECRRFLGRVSPQRVRMLGVAAIRETFEETGLLLGEQGPGEICPDLAPLEYIARAITPAESHIRYHARFFMVRDGAVGGEVRSNGELLDLEWLHFERARELPLVDVTRFVLEEAEHRLAGGPFRGVPLISYRKGAIRVRYESEPG
ncbi:MAG: NUDIX domain-containing protein [bacterium]|nr:NUDIX domain-containing protein [bacterium]MCP5043366.1 NUDIX domain-containing protein [bacterium]